MARSPNLILFLSDNHARDVMGCAGHPMVETPHMDRIASRGVRFENAWCASPLCCPSRAAIATGRYPHQTGCWDNALTYNGSVPTWHHRVREAGRNMTAIGKLHFRSAQDDNGFTDEIDTMHIVEGKGALIMLLRATPEGMPSRASLKALYEDSTVGEAEYQTYDRRITAQAIDWLHTHRDDDTPWVLLVSYASPHPPFKVPQRFWDRYSPDDVPMPVQWQADRRPTHPAVEYLSRINQIEDGFSEDLVRRVIAGYCGLISHTDEQIGEVMTAVEDLGLLDTTRVVYTSDHGEAAGHHGILGKANLYEHALAVPLIMAGPGIPEGEVIAQAVSHVDLFPTLVESVGAELKPEDRNLPGRSLWPLIADPESTSPQPVLAEYHAAGNRNSGFALREGDHKLVYHVDMPNQLFDLAADPLEEHDLLAGGGSHPLADALERRLRTWLDPEAVNAQSKADQAEHMTRFGGSDAVRKAGFFARSPIPGAQVSVERV